MDKLVKYWFYLCLLGLLVWTVTAFASPRIHSRAQLFHCLGGEDRFRHPERLQESILNLICAIKVSHGQAFADSLFTPMSDYRSRLHGFDPHYIMLESKLVRSQHTKGLAVDFILSNYIGLSRCEKMKLYRRDLEFVTSTIGNSMWYYFVGLGGYDNLTIHLDTRGRTASWFRINNNDVKFSTGFSWLEHQLQKCP